MTLRIRTGGNQINDFLTESGPSILRSELWGLMRLGGIERPGAMCDASDSARTCGDIEEFYDDESVFEDKVDFAISEVLAKRGAPHIPGFGEFGGSGE